MLYCILASEFTFQSGDIQISVSPYLLIKYISFTFQSGDIQIKRDMITVYQNHFKFTFQSGDIQIKVSNTNGNDIL